MRILIVGMDRKYNAEFFFKKAFEKLGHDVLLLNEYEGIEYPLITRILHTRTSLFKYYLKNLPINKNMIKEIHEIDPDVIIIFKGELVSEDNLKRISENYDSYLYYPDTFRFKPILQDRLKYFSTVFTAANEKDFYLSPGARRVVTVPWACDPELHRKLEINKLYNVSFIGTCYPNRGRIVRGFNDIYVFGSYWLRRKNTFPPVYGEEYVKVINETIINLNLHNNTDILADTPNMCTFEISGCGGFQIANSIRSIKKYFPQMPTFSDVHELKELVDYYLSSSNEIDEISLKNQEICYRNYKYEDSSKKIIENL